jgi:hypothetical protein
VAGAAVRWSEGLNCSVPDLALQKTSAANWAGKLVVVKNVTQPGANSLLRRVNLSRATIEVLPNKFGHPRRLLIRAPNEQFDQIQLIGWIIEGVDCQYVDPAGIEIEYMHVATACSGGVIEIGCDERCDRDRGTKCIKHCLKSRMV